MNQSIFQVNPISMVTLSDCKFATKMCPFVFRKAHIRILTISNMFKSYLKTNFLTFSDFNEYAFLFLSNFINLLFNKIEILLIINN